MVHKSLDVAQPGDVVVVDTSSSSLNAVLGDLVSTKARHRGIAGFVVDGLIRDLPDDPGARRLPRVRARRHARSGRCTAAPARSTTRSRAGGIVVNPGDVIVGDLNGVVVVPRDIADELLERLRLRAATESDYTSAVRAATSTTTGSTRSSTRTASPSRRTPARSSADGRSLSSRTPPARPAGSGRPTPCPSPAAWARRASRSPRSATAAAPCAARAPARASSTSGARRACRTAG